MHNCQFNSNYTWAFLEKRLFSSTKLNKHARTHWHRFLYIYAIKLSVCFFFVFTFYSDCLWETREFFSQQTSWKKKQKIVVRTLYLDFTVIQLIAPAEFPHYSQVSCQAIIRIINQLYIFKLIYVKTFCALSFFIFNIFASFFLLSCLYIHSAKN